MNSILKSKAKNITAILFSSFYAVMIILGFDFELTLFSSFRYAVNALLLDLLPLLLPVSVIVFIALKNKEFGFKKWILPIAFGITLAKSLVVFTLSALNSFTTFGAEAPMLFWLMFICSGLMHITFAVMFIGTLFSLKRIALLKYGAIGYVTLIVLGFVLNFIAVGGFEYIKSIPSEYWYITIKSFIKTLSEILFYIGVFLLSTNKKERVQEAV